MNAAVCCYGVAETPTHMFDPHADRAAVDVAISIILRYRLASARQRRTDFLVMAEDGLLHRAKGALRAVGGPPAGKPVHAVVALPSRQGSSRASGRRLGGRRLSRP
jgi:hypothetical protein